MRLLASRADGTLEYAVGGGVVARQRLAAWRDRLRVLATVPLLASDRRGRSGLLALMRGRQAGGSGANGDPVPIRMRALGGRAIHLRPGTTDIDVIADDFVFRYQLPPEEIRSHDLRRIWELGTNVGVGLVDLALRYPAAALVGVEPEPGNVEMARRNLAGLEDRCRLVEAAIWDEDGEIVVEGGQEYGLTVRARRAEDPPELHAMPAISLNSLLAREQPDGPIDFMLMDIEGTEQRVLARDTEWAEHVRAIKVELHPETGYTEHDCAADLQRLGFRTRLAPLWWGGFVIGLK